METNLFKAVWKNEYERVAGKIVSKYYPKMAHIHAFEDLMQEAALVFVEICNKNKADNGKQFYAFYTLSLHNHFKEMLQALFGTEKRKGTNISFDHTYDYGDSYNESPEEYLHDVSAFTDTFSYIELCERVSQAPLILQQALYLLLGLEVEGVEIPKTINDCAPSNNYIAKALKLKKMSPIYPFIEELKNLIAA